MNSLTFLYYTLIKKRLFEIFKKALFYRLLVTFVGGHKNKKDNEFLKISTSALRFENEISH